jgi:hypothetical protein
LRIFGAILIIIGLLVCLTIIGISFGVFLIFIGVLLVVFGGRRRTLITNIVQVSTTPGTQSLNLEDSNHVRPALTTDPRLIDVTPQPPHAPLSNLGAAPIRSTRAYQYDRAKWEALVEFDPDIAKVEATLRPLGAKYVDQFATGYLALGEKTYIDNIVQKVLETARQEDAERKVEEARWDRRFSDPAFLLKFGEEKFDFLMRAPFGNVAILKSGHVLVERDSHISRYPNVSALREAADDLGEWPQITDIETKTRLLRLVAPHISR